MAKPLDLDELERIAYSVARYHADKARYGGAGFEFHARAQTFMDGATPALIARVRELESALAAAPNPHDAIDANCEIASHRATIATLTAERDAAIRERDAFMSRLAEVVAERERADRGNTHHIERLKENLADAHRSWLTLTAEERAALEWLGRYVAKMLDPVSETPVPPHMPVWAIRNTIDRLIAGARTVAEPAAEEVVHLDLLTFGEARRKPGFIAGHLVIEMYEGAERHQFRARDQYGRLMSMTHHSAALQTRFLRGTGVWSYWSYHDHLSGDGDQCRLILADEHTASVAAAWLKEGT